MLYSVKPVTRYDVVVEKKTSYGLGEEIVVKGLYTEEEAFKLANRLQDAFDKGVSSVPLPPTV